METGALAISPKPMRDMRAERFEIFATCSGK